MSSTNHTTNYNLPQFLGSDKPAWLSDINPAFSAIDTAMKANETAAAQGVTDSGTANTNIGTMANLTTTDKSSLVNAINEVKTDLGTVSGVASGASASAAQANLAITQLANYLNLVRFEEKTPTIGAGTVHFNRVYCATNAEGSVGKVYGFLSATCTNPQGTTITIPSEFRPTEDINVYGICLIQNYSDPANTDFAKAITIHTNGDITIDLNSGEYNRQLYIKLMACMIFAKNFGDQPLAH